MANGDSLHTAQAQCSVALLMVIKSYTFEAEPVLMDFHDFRHCTFKRCRLIFCGYSNLRIDSCRFEDCRWEFSGPAMATLELLSNLNRSGTELGRLIVQQAIAIITQPPPGGPAQAPAFVPQPRTNPAPTSQPPSPSLPSAPTSEPSQSQGQ